MDHGLNNFTVFSGLDPAGPLFEGYDPKVRLDQGDAEYVDVIHSNGESLIVGGFGAWEPMGINLFKISIMLNIKLSTILYNTMHVMFKIRQFWLRDKLCVPGHVDFYPNGGRAQRGCQHLLIGGLYDFIYCKFIHN